MRNVVGPGADDSRGRGRTAMNAQLRYLMVLAALAATPAWGQTAAPAPSLPFPGAASIPDFSGVWAHPSWPSFEPPLTGPGPVRNRSRQRTGESNANELVRGYTHPTSHPPARDAG